MASITVLGFTLMPATEHRGCKRKMTIPILGSGGLDILIPSSALDVLLPLLDRLQPERFFWWFSFRGSWWPT